MARIMVRHAIDDFDAMHIANGMEAAGAQVFSITATEPQLNPGALVKTMRYTVWAKIPDESICDAVDAAIDKERDAD
jgi:hypothetical protein